MFEDRLLHSGKGQHAYPGAAHFDDFRCARGNGHAGCQHIVYQQNVLALQLLCIVDGKDSLHGVPSFPSAFPGLGGVVDDSCHGSGVDRYLCDLGYAFGNPFALVVPAFP